MALELGVKPVLRQCPTADAFAIFGLAVPPPDGQSLPVLLCYP